MKLIVIEGPDLSGKDTCIDELSRQYLDSFVVKSNYRPTSKGDTYVYDRYYSMFKAARALKCKIVIFNRFFASEAVYSILRGPDRLYSEVIGEIAENCKNYDIKYIQLEVSNEELRRRYKERGDDHVKIDQLEMLNDRYNRFFEWLNINKIKINMQDTDWLDQMKTFIEE